MAQSSHVTNDEPSLEKGARSTAWLVYLGQPWLEKLNAVQAIQKQDPNTPLRLEAINDGVFLEQMNHRNWRGLAYHVRKAIKH